MPWKVVKDQNKRKPFKIVNVQTGEIVGRSATRRMAQASVRARYANMPQKERAALRRRKHYGR